MTKMSGRRIVLFGVILASTLGLVTLGFAMLKGGLAGGPVTVVAEKESFGGVGLEIAKQEGEIVVVGAIEGAPAQKAGVQAGDRIAEINGEPLGDDPVLQEVVSKLRGEPGTEVTVTVKRGDEKKTFTIVRGKLQAPEPRIRVFRGTPPRFEQLEPEEFWPFHEGWPWMQREHKELLDEYREALKRYRDARNKLWRSFPRPEPLWEWRFPEELFRRPPMAQWPGEKEELRMDMDVHETDDAITIKCDMPGMKKDDIEVSLRGNLLTIKGTRKVEEETKDEKGRIVRKERRFGSFSRSFTVPQKVKPEDIKTSYENGVLTIVIPKAPEPGEEKEIKINIGTI